MAGSLPELIGIHEDYADHRDQFQIIAIHDGSVESLKELDARLAGIKRRFWQGKELPFPILLDGANETKELFGIRGYPTHLLVDPEGKLVGRISIADFKQKLPPLAASRTWERYRDMARNLYWYFEPGNCTLTQLAGMLTRWVDCEVMVDEASLKALELTSETNLRGMLVGVPVSLRTIEEVLLAPLGLGIVPSADDQHLLIAGRAPVAEPPSYVQENRAKELRELLEREQPDGNGRSSPLEIQPMPLLEAVKLIERDYRLPMAVDVHADDKLNLQVSGSVGPGRLGKSLRELVEPLDLEVAVKHEVIWIGRKAK